jgi:hypothetical protein
MECAVLNYTPINGSESSLVSVFYNKTNLVTADQR